MNDNNVRSLGSRTSTEVIETGTQGSQDTYVQRSQEIVSCDEYSIRVTPEIRDKFLNYGDKGTYLDTILKTIWDKHILAGEEQEILECVINDPYDLLAAFELWKNDMFWSEFRTYLPIFSELYPSILWEIFWEEVWNRLKSRVGIFRDEITEEQKNEQLLRLNISMKY